MCIENSQALLLSSILESLPTVALENIARDV